MGNKTSGQGFNSLYIVKGLFKNPSVSFKKPSDNQNNRAVRSAVQGTPLPLQNRFCCRPGIIYFGFGVDVAVCLEYKNRR